MRRRDEEALQVSLTKVIMAWWDDPALDGIERPYIGDGTWEIMAQAAIAVLRGIDDVYDTLNRNGELREAD